MNESHDNIILGIEELSAFLRYQDVCLEKIELLLYKMERLAIQAASDDLTVERQTLQEELESLKAEIDCISSQMNQLTNRAG